MNKKGKVISLVLTILYLIFFTYGLGKLKEVYSLYSNSVGFQVMLALFVMSFFSYILMVYMVYDKYKKYCK